MAALGFGEEVAGTWSVVEELSDVGEPARDLVHAVLEFAPAERTLPSLLQRLVKVMVTEQGKDVLQKYVDALDKGGAR